MHINQISYVKTFNLGNYSSEKIGVEIFINEGDDAKQALDTAKSLVEEYHKSLEFPEQHIQERYIPDDKLPEIQVQKEVREQTLEEQIQSCKEVKVLESYKFIAKKDIALQVAYDAQMKMLLSIKAIDIIKNL